MVRLIAGMSRAGTSWLSKWIGSHPQVAAIGETLFWGRGYVTPMDGVCYGRDELERILPKLTSVVSGSRGDRPGDLRILEEDTFGKRVRQAFLSPPKPITPADLFARFGQLVAEAEGKSYFLEKTPHHVMWADRIFDAMPRSRMVVMVREPYGFMLSYKHQGDRRRASSRRAFQMRYHPFGCALVWRGYHLATRAAARAYPEQVMLVSFDDLRNRPVEVLNSVQHFFGLDPVYLEPPRETNTSFPDFRRPELAPDDIFWMNLVNSRHIATSGVPRRSVPVAPWRIARSALLLPVWGIRNVVDMRRLTAGSLTRYLWRWWRRPASEGAA